MAGLFVQNRAKGSVAPHPDRHARNDRHIRMSSIIGAEMWEG
jgi:hypothetical protein